ncbi:MAG: hypothetical protein M3N68_10030 [Actinomycetota bacterium]|nr:hypothetical protein [Actinomycetota bacterium]
MNPDKRVTRRASHLAALTSLVAALALLVAGPAAADGHGGPARADDGSVASGSAHASDNSTASGDAVADNGSVASGCSVATDWSTASGGICPEAAKPRRELVPPHKDKIGPRRAADKGVREAAPAQATRVSKLAFTGPRVAPWVAAATVLMATGGLLMLLGSPRRRAVKITP